MTKSKSTPAKVDANRKNALKSTGPKTSKGKSIVKWNALKHGLLSKEVVIAAGDGEENPEEFDSLHEQLREELHPHGVLEQMLVEKIVICYWRLRRAIQCENGEIRRRLDTTVIDIAKRRASEFHHNLRFSMLDCSRDELMDTSAGLTRFIAELKDVRAEVEETSQLSDSTLHNLTEKFGSDEGGITRNLWLLNRFVRQSVLDAESDDSESDDPEDEKLPDAAHCTKALMGVIDKELDRLNGLTELVEHREALEYDSTALQLRLPSKEVVDKLLRYETTIERQLYRAIDQLERLQRSRRGEQIPPPVNVQLSNDS